MAPQFVSSEKFIEAHECRLENISIFSQESNQTTWRLCKMNLAIRGIDNDGIKWGDSMEKLTAELSEQLRISKGLEKKKNT